jgi:hypothetical protein
MNDEWGTSWRNELGLSHAFPKSLSNFEHRALGGKPPFFANYSVAVTDFPDFP